MRLDRRQLLYQVLDECPTNRREGVAIVETERREFVAPAAEVERFPQGEFLAARFFPKFFGGFVSVRSGFVQRVLFQIQAGVDCHHGCPRPILQPVLLHFALA